MTLRHTPLHAAHTELGAKLVPYAGYEMPIQYGTGITAEHMAVRSAAGLFDVSHMGEFAVSGPGARDFLQFVTTNDVDRLEVGQAQYTTLLDGRGRLLDDLLVYRLADHYLLVVNASNRDRDLAHLKSHAPDFDVRLEDRSDDTALLALQGPLAAGILARLSPDPLSTLGFYRSLQGTVDGRPTLISRTGYTGEDGFELYVAPGDAYPLWQRLLEVGREDGLIPTGLGARDSLRLEMGYALYGNDLDEEHTPLEAGLGWVVRFGSGDFVGRDALLRQKEAGVPIRLAGFRLLERAFPRPGHAVRVNDDSARGVVTSGTVSPTLGVGIGLAYLPVEVSAPGTALEVIIRDRAVPAEVVRPPFYTGGSART